MRLRVQAVSPSQRSRAEGAWPRSRIVAGRRCGFPGRPSLVSPSFGGLFLAAFFAGSFNDFLFPFFFAALLFFFFFPLSCLFSSLP